MQVILTETKLNTNLKCQMKKLKMLHKTKQIFTHANGVTWTNLKQVISNSWNKGASNFK